MSDENETCFHVYYGGRFNTGDNGYVSYVGGNTKIIKAPARLLFNRLATITPLYGFYGMRIWYKLPYEKLNELVILYNGSDAFHKLCEIGAWVKLIEVYMEKDDSVTDTEPAVDIASPQYYRNDETESCEEEARINAVLSHEDDSDNDDIPRTPPASDCERFEEDYERWVRGSGELKIKQIFMSVKEFREAVVEYALKGGWNIKFARWGTIKSEAVCGVVGEIKCPWRIYCSYDERVDGFMVKTFFEQHSCIKDGRCRILSDNIIAELFVNDVRNDPDMKIQKALKNKGKYSFKVYKVIRREEDKRKYCRSLPGPTGLFEVIDQGISYKVNMLLRICSCRRWELTGIPCRHSLRVVLDKKLNVEDYVSHWDLGSTW